MQTADDAMDDPLDDAGFRRALVAERGEAVAQLQSMEHEFAAIVDGSVDANGDDEHDPEGSTVAFERSRVGALVAASRERVDEIDRALDRLTAGSFGRCQQCGDHIGPERLRARPATSTCISCASSRPPR